MCPSPGTGRGVGRVGRGQPLGDNGWWPGKELWPQSDRSSKSEAPPASLRVPPSPRNTFHFRNLLSGRHSPSVGFRQWRTNFLTSKNLFNPSLVLENKGTKNQKYSLTGLLRKEFSLNISFFFWRKVLKKEVGRRLRGRKCCSPNFPLWQLCWDYLTCFLALLNRQGRTFQLGQLW